MGPASGNEKGVTKVTGGSGHITIFMAGDVMTGRGIDQVLPYPSDPVLYEPYVKSALQYVDFAERANGEIDKPVAFDHIWGDALKELERVSPDIRMINLETSVTKSDDRWRAKQIHYRMSPDNIPCITAAKIDLCTLANNHVLDWGYDGLRDTLDTLRKAGIKSTGAGGRIKEAEAPAVMDVNGKGRVIVFSYGIGSSGIPKNWAATDTRAGVSRLDNLSDGAVKLIGERVSKVKKKGDVVVVSIHWGFNWGYEIPDEHTTFAHRLIDKAGVDIIFGHSSHHPKGIEVYKDGLIIYGSGDIINDYEGISGHDAFRADLTLMYFVSVDPSNGKLTGLHMTPMQIRNFRLVQPTNKDAKWLRGILDRECKKLGTGVEMSKDNTFTLKW
jgi:poly-gamma-glutamate synthesis protein (capsule biosynthesis protein)